MMTSTLRIHVLAALAATAMASYGVAEENLLWKSASSVPAFVVPAYGGQASPFPTTAKSVDAVSESTALMAEQQRLRDEAFAAVQKQLEGGRGLVPDLTQVRVGGMVEGTRGARVLISNQWVAVGSEVRVRQYKSPAAGMALKDLATYDPATAASLEGKLDAELAAKPVLALTLRSLTSRTLVLSSSKGSHTINFNLNSN